MKLRSNTSEVLKSLRDEDKAEILDSLIDMIISEENGVLLEWFEKSIVDQYEYSDAEKNVDAPDEIKGILKSGHLGGHSYKVVQSYYRLESSKRDDFGRAGVDGNGQAYGYTFNFNKSDAICYNFI